MVDPSLALAIETTIFIGLVLSMAVLALSFLPWSQSEIDAVDAEAERALDGVWQSPQPVYARVR